HCSGLGPGGRCDLRCRYPYPGYPPGPSDHVRCLGRSTESKTQEAPATKTIAILRPPPICSHFCTGVRGPNFRNKRKMQRNLLRQPDALQHLCKPWIGAQWLVIETSLHLCNRFFVGFISFFHPGESAILVTQNSIKVREHVRREVLAFFSYCFQLLRPCSQGPAVARTFITAPNSLGRTCPSESCHEARPLVC